MHADYTPPHNNTHPHTQRGVTSARRYVQEQPTEPRTYWMPGCAVRAPKLPLSSRPSTRGTKRHSGRLERSETQRVWRQKQRTTRWTIGTQGLPHLLVLVQLLLLLHDRYARLPCRLWLWWCLWPLCSLRERPGHAATPTRTTEAGSRGPAVSHGQHLEQPRQRNPGTQAEAGCVWEWQAFQHCSRERWQFRRVAPKRKLDSRS